MMKIGLGFKLFTALLAIAIVMVMAMGIANRISFQHGFIGYLNDLETKRLEVLTSILANHWREVDDPQVGWGTLRGREDLWRHVVRYSGYRVHSGPGVLKGFSFQGLPLPLSVKQRLSAATTPASREVVPGRASMVLGVNAARMWGPADNEADDWEAVKSLVQPQPQPQPSAPAPAPAPASAPAIDPPARLGLLEELDALDELPELAPLEPVKDVEADDARIKPPVLAQHGSRRRGWEEEADGLRPSPVDAAARMTLQDANGLFVVGNPTPGLDAIHVPVMVDGQLVGWVLSTPFTEVTDAADLAFQRRQETAVWYIAGLALLLAGLITWALARVMLVPTRRLAAATRALAEGNYETRVPVRSEDELGQLARMFNRLASTLQRTENMRRSLMADVSHELRTPLAIMRGELESVEDGLQPLDQRVLESLQVEVATLSKLVDDIHQLALAEVGPLSYRWQVIDVGSLLEQMLPAWRERLGSRGLSLKTTGLADKICVSGDPDRLRQVFQNVLENAVRYADCGGMLQVSCQREGPNAVIAFDDSGPGMPETDYARLFDRFYRREASRNRATGGSGLGLAICRGIVEAHGGRIFAQESPLGGLRIRIELLLDVLPGGSV